MDINRAGPICRRTILSDRRAASHKDHWNFQAAGIHHRAKRVRRANADMHHHGLRLTSDHGVAMRHSYGHGLVWHQNRFDHRIALFTGH